jgi:hypothetical protein
VVVMLIFVYIIKFPGNINRAGSDLKDGTAAAYNNELNSRYLMLKNNESKKCTVSRLKFFPKTLFFTDISEKTAPEMLRSYAAFFNKDSIFVEPN